MAGTGSKSCILDPSSFISRLFDRVFSNMKVLLDSMHSICCWYSKNDKQMQYVWVILPKSHVSLLPCQSCTFTKELYFLAHLVFYQTSLCNHDLSVVHSCHPASASVHSPPSHRIQDRNFIFSMNMHMCPQYMHIKYLVILTCSF